MGKVEFDLSSIKFSRNDINHGIILPRVMTKLLAEEIGFFIGDGSANIYNYRNRGNYYVQYSGNLSEELEYYKNRIMPVLETLYNCTGSIRRSRKDNSFNLSIRSKAIANFKINVLKLPFGKKSDKIYIPKIISSNRNFLCSFLRGLADADFSLTFKKKHKNVHYYPVLKASLGSEIIIRQMFKELKGLDIKSYVYYGEKRYDNRTDKTYVLHNLFISGKDNLEKWYSKIGFNNPVHVTKYLIWKRFGFCPPYTSLSERTAILNNEIDITRFTPR